MVFEIKGKVALITGGASGIGLHYAKQLLRTGAKGVVLADINPELGQKALEEIGKDFSSDTFYFFKTDVTDKKQFEDAFKKTVQIFKNIDILVNNAGICDDAKWETEIKINVNGVINGMLLGLDHYLPKYKQGDEAVIVNMSSTAGVGYYCNIPIYVATKFAVLGLTKCWGDPYHYERSKVRVLAVCPGPTMTPMFTQISGRNLGEPYEKYKQDNYLKWPTQEPDHLAREFIRVVRKAPIGTAWVVEGGEPAYEYVAPDRETMKGNQLQ